MFHLIVTNDPELVKKAREYGAGVFKAEKLPEGFATERENKPHVPMKPHEILRELNINPGFKGYDYIKYLMEQCESDPEYHAKGVGKVIYPQCAEKFGATTNSVERAIRHALQGSFRECPEKYSEMFQRTFTKSPTNTQFIGLVSEYFAANK